MLRIVGVCVCLLERMDVARAMLAALAITRVLRAKVKGEQVGMAKRMEG